MLKVSLATDHEGRVFQRRAAECMRSRLGLELVDRLLGWMEIVEGYGLLEEDVEEQLDRVSEELRQYDGMERQIGEEEWIKVEISDPTETVRTLRKEGILKWVVEDVGNLSETVIDPGQYISGRIAKERSIMAIFPYRKS